MNQTDIATLRQDSAQPAKALAQQWLDSFEAALRNNDKTAVSEHFSTESYWRDVLAFTWHLTPYSGADKIAAALTDLQATVQAHGFSIPLRRTQPRRAQRAGVDVIEAIFEFETAIGRGHGVVRLLADQPSRAFQLMTSLQELKGFEEMIDERRPTGAGYSHNFGAANWKDRRIQSQEYLDREPTVLVVGGSQAGLTVAARLGRLGVDTLVVDKHERVGDNWRKRYHALVLHNHVAINHLPYMPFPPSWPLYLPKDMVADWLESYAWAMEMNFWTGTEFTGATYDEATGQWKAVVRRADGSERTLSPRHIIFANGIIGLPRIPDIPGLKDFKGDMMHTSKFTSGAHWKGKKALVLGSGTSGHDVAQDLYSNGVDTTIIQRGSTIVVNIPSARLAYGIHDDGTPLEDADLLVTVNTLPVTIRNLQRVTARMAERDKELLDGLTTRGFKWDFGEDKAGHLMKSRRRLGGYYLNAGCSELIVSGDIGLLQFDQIEKFVAEGALLKDGSVKPADLLVLATGFFTQQVLVASLLGEKVAERVGTIWGLSPNGELNNMWTRTAQEGLWFVGGSFINCRIYSKYVALQIKAIEEGLLSKSIS